MSRKFRWFLLGACVFVVLTGGGEALSLLAAGPQAQSKPSDFAHVHRQGVERGPALGQLEAAGELARWEASRE
jgi:hypothetical protein